MQRYSDTNPPRRGTARKIYQAFKRRGWRVNGLWYNPNNWGRCQEAGWGTWACEVEDDGGCTEIWCGWDREHGVYLQASVAPFAVIFIESPLEE